jgi:PKD repeat protein
MYRKSTKTLLELLASTRNSLVGSALLLGSAGMVGAQSYCGSSASSTADSNIGQVILNSINNNTVGICATYSNFTSITTNLTIGNTYSLSVLAGTCGGNYQKFGKVFIDYNHDFDFVDAGEEVFGFGPGVNPLTFTTNISVPGTALLGPTRMRVIAFETGALSDVTPCSNYTWGETEDYGIVIMPSAPNDIGVTLITNPNSGCSMSSNEQVTVRCTNFGTNTQNAWNVSYRVNGGAIVTEPITGQNLASGGNFNYTFTATTNMGTPGTYTIKAWTSLGADLITLNDSTTKIVTGIPGVSTYPYFEGFESGNGGWLPGGALSSWAMGTPAKQVIIGAATGANAYVTGGLGLTDYNNNEDSYILGPCFDLTVLQNPWISLSIWWQAETGWDGTNLQYSTDFGTTWLNVGAYNDPGNWYNSGTLIATPGGSGDGWNGNSSFSQPPSSGGWVTAAHRLDGLAGAPSVRFRFTFGSDGSVSDDGIAIDNIRIADGPVANLGADTLICGGDSLLLDAGPFSSFQWSNGQQTQLDTITQTSTGTIWVKITDVNGFYDFDTVVVNLSNPQVNVGQDSSICPGDTVLLDAGNHPGGSFLWNDNTTNQTNMATTAGFHGVLVTDSVGCQKMDSMLVTILVPPSLSLGNDTTVCIGTPVYLDGGPGPTGTTYQWNNGSQTQVVIIASPGIYAASVTTPGGCAAVDTVEVFNHPSPAVNLGANRTECGPYVLNAGPGGTSYLWNTGAFTQTINGTTPGAYSVTVVNQFGCSRSDTVLITMSTPPTVGLGPDQVLCNGQNIVLNAGNPGMTYLWSNASTAQSLTVTTPGTYFVRVTSPQGCIGTDTVVIGNSALNVNLGPNVSMCGSQAVVLNAGNPGSTYLWSTGSSLQIVSVNAVGTYSVTVTDNIGCTATDAITVGQVPGTVAAFTNPATGTLLQAVPFADNSTGGANQWFYDFGDGQSSTQQNPSHTYLAFGVYTITQIVTDGTCRDTTTGTITINSFVGVEDDDFAQSLQLWPNPSSGMFHLLVEFAKPISLTMEITDLSGKVLLHKTHNAAVLVNEDFDLGEMSKGIYILRMEAAGKQVFHKLVVQ